MTTANLYSETGQAKGTIELPASLFGQPVHEQALHDAVRSYLANQRQGTHDTKTRAEVNYSSAKLYRQKGTGRARAGSAQSPTRVGGGTAFGPHPRSYSSALPRKVKRLALTSALSDRAAHERVHVVEDPSLTEPKTATVARLLQTMALPEGRHTLVVLPADQNVLFKSSHELNAYTVLWADNVVFTQKALAGAQEVFGS
jgi:large subunit ribosomal protein L4